MSNIYKFKASKLFTALMLLFIGTTFLTNAQNNTRPSVTLPNNFEVNSYTGNLFHSRTDFKIPSKGLSIDITFSYNHSRRSKNWGMGKGWTFNYNMAYLTDSSGLWVERMDGRRDLFKHQGSVYISPLGVFDTLVEYQSGKFSLKTKENITYYFENSTHKRLTKIVDQNSNQILLSYTDSLLNALTDGAGHTLNFTWTNGKLTEVKDISCSPERKVNYEYDTSGNPVKVINPLNDFVLYYYDSTSKIIGYADEGDRRMSITYNARTSVSKVVSCITNHQFSYLPSQFKTYVTEIVNGDRVVTTYQFDTSGKIITKIGNCCGYNNTFQYDNETNVIKKIDGKGNFLRYEYDPHGNITKEIDMLGNAREFSYNLSTNKLNSSKDKNGNVSTYIYDVHGNLTELHKPLGVTEYFTYDASGNMLTKTDGNNKTTSYEYNSSGYLTKITNAAGGITTMTYDCHGNKLSETDPNSNTTLFEYDALNQLTKRTNALGQVTEMAYDKTGNLITLKNALNKTTTYFYDGLDRLIKVTSPLGISIHFVYDEQGNVIRQIDGNGKPTIFTYNSRRQVVTETDALGNSISYNYDDAGNRTSMKDKRGGNTVYEYNDIYQLIKTTNPLGGSRTYGYDAEGNRLVEIDPKGNITTYEYDALNRLVKVNDPYNKSILYTYDAAGNRLTKKDKRSHTTTYTYDNVNRLKTVTDASGGQIVFTYDLAGNKLSEKDALNHSSTYTYDALNRVVSQMNPLNELTQYNYDAVGNLNSTSIPNGNTISNHYDDDNRLTSITDALGAIKSFGIDNNGNILIETDANGNSTSYQYDFLNRRFKTTDALGMISQKTFDAGNNVLTETDRNGYVKTYTYDLLNRKLSETDAIGGRIDFTYDANGNQLSIKDPNNNSTIYNYDALNRLTQESFANGTSKQYTYDENGNIKTRRDNNNSLTQYTYDNLDRLSSRVYPGSNTNAFTYDAVGNLLSATNSNAVIAYTYDNADRVLSETMNGKTTAYSYNVSNGTRNLIYPGGRTIVEEFDDRDRLQHVKEGATNLATFAYDAGGRITQKMYANGSATNYTYNNNDWVTNLASQPGNAIGFTYAYDAEGNKMNALKNHFLTNSEKYTYDSLYRVKSYKEGTLSSGNIGSPLTQTQYNYDRVGNRTSVVKDAVNTTYTVNAVNAYTTINAGNVVNPGYDANGNLLSDGLHTYAYDAENRLISVDGGVTATYNYDALGRRIQKITASATINYYFDEDKAIEERNAANITQATYVYGTWIDDILSMRRNGNDYYYLKNDLGSIVAVLNSAGAVVERYEYDAFGKVSIYNGAYVLQPATTIGNVYMFTGREYDSETGNYYYRARHYSSVTGRFLQQDPLGYVDGLNLYAYVGNNGVNFIDPYGLRNWRGVVVSSIGLVGNGLGAAAGIGLGVSTSWTGVGGFVGGAIAIKSAYGVGANLANLRAAWNDEQMPSTGALTNDIARAVFPCSDLAQGIATAADIGLDLSGIAFTRAAAARASMLTVQEEASRMSSTNAANAGVTGFRYMSLAELKTIRETGYLRGGLPGETYFTKDIYKSAAKAQSRLSLGSPPTLRVEFEILNDPKLLRNGTKVKPLNGMIGNGSEFMSLEPVKVKLINWQPLR